jgi:glycosyltransferase involved in cell wall biosynthesis
MLILTDFAKFATHWKTATMEGDARASLAGASFWDLFRLIPEIRQADLIIINEGAGLVSMALFFCMMPFLKKPIIAVDLLLRKPSTRMQKLEAFLKKMLLKRVDHFIHYFQALEGYQKWYGISSARSSYVPFKANLYGNPAIAGVAATEKSEFVLAVGQSLRDYDTFFDAVSKVEHPAAICRPNFAKLRQHGARFTRSLENFPGNVVVLDDDGSREGWIKTFCKARIVVIPILRDTMRPAGIGVYLDAMLLKKCVIITSGPGVSDVLTDQAIIIPPEDPAALAQAIRKIWENPALEEEVALRGYRYAVSLGGEPELMNRILESVMSWYSHR